MNRKTAAWYVAGFLTGIASLLAALHLAPKGALAPASASAGQQAADVAPRQTAAEQYFYESAARYIQNLTKSPAAEPREAALKSDLQTLRSQLELYAFQHLNKFPWQTAHNLDSAGFHRQLIGKTDAHGNTHGLGVNLGPYLQTMPSNPFVSGPSGSAVSFGDGPCPGDGATGWYVDRKTNTFRANDAAHKGL